MRLALLLFSLFLSACAATTTFTRYPSKIAPYKQSLSTVRPPDLSQCLVSECSSADAILYWMERGRMAQIVDSLDVSMRDYAAAMEKIRENDDRAVVSASQIGSNAAAVMVNDNAIPYEGEWYERIALHHYQAINYLRKGDLEGARVEARRANAEQEEALRRFEGEVEKATEKAKEKGIGPAQLGPVHRQYAQLDEIAGKVKNSFQNACTFHLSGLIYELAGEENDAYIDYKRALEIHPDNRTLQRDVIRLAKRLGMGDDLSELTRRFSIDPDTIPAEGGNVVVIHDEGFVPEKKEVKIPVPIPGSGIIALAFPIYEPKYAPPLPLEVLIDEQDHPWSEPLCDYRILAVKALKEKVPSMVTRMVIRAIVKATSAHEAKKRGGAGAGLLATLWNVVSENADLRSWLTLPEASAITRFSIPPGNHEIRFQTATGTTRPLPLTVEPGKLYLIQVTHLGGATWITDVSLPFRTTTIQSRSTP
ncbi:MAG: hypothetical protein Fur0034_00220 [Desulfuromonadia bacterium]